MNKLYDQLMDISMNLWWCWQPEVISIFRDMDADLWREVNHNAIAFLKRLGPEKLQERVSELAIESRVIYAAHRLQEYMLLRSGWGPENAASLRSRPIAYFSAEFGLHESLPIYSGGLGVLAGDHLKSASDLGVPIVGVGLFYDQGYFRQSIDAEGWQQESYGNADEEMLPMQVAEGRDGKPLTIEVETRNESVAASVYKLQVGRSLLILLKPLPTEEEEADQKISSHSARLYGGNERVRIRQELLLGVGGLRALRALGVDPGVLHLNEGHCAFATLEAIRYAMAEQGFGFSEAKRYVSAMTVFTTHTPVEAGHDRFPPKLVEEQIGPLRDELKIDQAELLGLGRTKPDDDKETFCMTVLALKTSQRANGVSCIHGGVSRRMWNDLWPQRDEHEVPIGHITNGVHVSSWVAPQMRKLYERYLGRQWIEQISNRKVWRGVEQINDEELWETHRVLKGHLVNFVRRREMIQAEQRGEPVAEVKRRCSLLNPDYLTIGFARRFALYKRAGLLIEDEEWLKGLLGNLDRPVQVVFAGKAHPQDEKGKELIQRIFRLSRDKSFEGRIFLVENYDINVGRHLVQGVDVWLNNPRRPLEACGTSGQKVVLNGGLNCSTLDGWWAEGYDGQNGFAIGSGKVHKDTEEHDRREAQELKKVLSEEVVPLFYRRDQSGLPREWIRQVKNALMSLGWRYCAARMMIDYTQTSYLPAGGANTAHCPDG
jgi:starch phosphorylase